MLTITVSERFHVILLFGKCLWSMFCGFSLRDPTMNRSFEDLDVSFK